MIVTTVPTQHGQSVSPLLNEKGQLVRVVPYISNEAQGSASPATIVQRIVAKAGHAAPLPFTERPRHGGNLPLVMDADFRAGAEAFPQDRSEAEDRMKRAAKKYPESPLPLTFKLVQRIG